MRTHEGGGWRRRKRLGQHFLRDQSIIQRIISVAGFHPTSFVLEVGPGLGALTLPLARSVGHIYAVEKDERIAEKLEGRIRRMDLANVTLINQDILRFDFGDLPALGKIDVIGNLPYSISTPFLEKLIENRNRVARAVLMFQKEVGRRLTAPPGNKEYGSLTVLVQYYARTFPVMEIPRQAFSPPPQVDSMVLKMDFEIPHPLRAPNEENLKRVVRGAFSHRRKTLLNSLRGSACAFSPEDLHKAFHACRIDGGKRAETLSIDDYICLSSNLPRERETCT